VAGSGTAHLRPTDDTLLHAEHIVVEFPVGRSGLKVNAVSDVSLDILEGETLGLVGESGCGKSTTARAMIQLPRPTSGTVVFEGQDLTKLKGEALRQVRPRMQMIFQDPISSLNPRRKIGDLVAEGLEIWNIGDKSLRQKKADEVLDAVGLDPEQARLNDREEHLALLARWAYSSWRDGELLVFEDLDRAPYRRLVRAVSRVGGKREL